MPTAPCEPYISHDQLAACCDDVDPLSDASTTIVSRQVASSILFYATGQQYAGTCEAWLRPQWRCSPCRPFQPDLSRPWEPALIDGHWVNLRCGTPCACDSERCGVNLSQVNVAEIIDVYIDGMVIDADKYYFHAGKLWLTEGCWPDCNAVDRPAFPELVDPATPASEFVGTFGVRVLQGVAVPELLQQATKELACHYQNLCGEDCDTCKIALGFASPDVTVDYAFNDILPWVYIGIPTVDAVIRILNPYGFNKVRGSIWSPEANEATWDRSYTGGSVGTS